METNEYGQTWQQAWDLYFRNHPNVLASWGHQNGRWMNCTCAKCDLDELRPRPDILVAFEE